MLTFFYGVAPSAGHTARRPGDAAFQPVMEWSRRGRRMPDAGTQRHPAGGFSPGYPASAMSPWMAPVTVSGSGAGPIAALALAGGLPEPCCW